MVIDIWHGIQPVYYSYFYMWSKIPAETGETSIGYCEDIANEASTLPLEEQGEILDFTAFLKTRQV